MTAVSYIIYRTDKGNQANRPIEAQGVIDADTLLHIPLDDGQEVFAFDETPHIERGSPDEWALSSFDPVSHEVKPRPSLPSLITEGKAPMTLDLGALPENTLLSLSNEAGDTMELILPLSESLTLTDPGGYTLRISPPFPWLPREEELTVA